MKDEEIKIIKINISYIISKKKVTIKRMRIKFDR